MLKQLLFMAVFSFCRCTDIDKYEVYTLTNDNGVSAKFCNYGGRWLSMNVPDNKGNFGDVVLGFDSIEGYLNAHEQYHGAITGRVCGRINQGVCKIDDVEYHFANNDGFGKPLKNHLHGGIKGFHKKIWNAVQSVNNKNEQFVEFSYNSKDGEEGYPGNLEVNVRYTLTNDNAVVIDYYAITDKTTLVNLTNHAFFNLSGDPVVTVSNHIMWLNADKYLECDSELVPTGNILPVKDTPLDFTIPARIGERLDSEFPEIVKGRGFAVAFVIGDNNDSIIYDDNVNLRHVASLQEPISGRTMDVYTNQKSLQVYNAWLMDGSDIGKNNTPYYCGAGIAIETQNFPDAPNHSNFPPIALRKGEVYQHTAVYSFKVLSDVN